MKSHVLQVARLNMRYAEANLNDIPEGQFDKLPAGLVNPPAWIVGHIVLVNERVIGMLGGQAACTDECAALFQAPPAAGAGPYPSKDDLLAALASSFARLEEAFQAADDDALAQSLPDDSMREVFPTVGDMVVGVLTIHPAIHLGQLSAWRTAMGMELPI